jgi:hypothetical protein
VVLQVAHLCHVSIHIVCKLNLTNNAAIKQYNTISKHIKIDNTKIHTRRAQRLRMIHRRATRCAFTTSSDANEDKCREFICACFLAELASGEETEAAGEVAFGSVTPRFSSVTMFCCEESLVCTTTYKKQSKNKTNN